MGTPVDLVLGDAPEDGLPVDLVFGAGEEYHPPVEMTLDGVIPVVDELTLEVRAATVRVLEFAGLLPESNLTMAVVALYVSGAERPLVNEVGSPWEVAVPKENGVLAAHQDGVAQLFGSQSLYEVAVPLEATTTSAYEDSLRLGRSDEALFENATRLQAAMVDVRHQEAIRGVRLTRVAAHQDATRLRAMMADIKHENGIHLERKAVTSAWQEAVGLTIGVVTGAGIAKPLEVGIESWWDEAMRPLPGEQTVIIVPTNPCYTPPVGSVPLLFDKLWSDDSNLLFICENHDEPPPEPGETIVVPVRRVYVVINTTSLRRVDGNIPIPAFGMNLSLDRDSWTWQWSASVPAASQEILEPEDGVPVEIEMMINGTAYRGLVTNIGRDRQFADARVRISGKGTNAVLDAPYAQVQAFKNTINRDAQQIMGDILTLNGVPLDWEVEWNIDDWLIPAGLFIHQGTYISALNQIAQAAGAYIQPHPSERKLRVLHQYPLLPRDWADLPVDYELPWDVTSREGIEWRDQVRYNRVYVSGQDQGVLCQVNIDGTDGSAVAPMVVDRLITEAVAGRQRGRTVLGAGGRFADVTLRLPVLAETNIILPGKVVDYVDNSITRRGIVRSVNVEVGFPEVWQNIGVETYVPESV